MKIDLLISLVILQFLCVKSLVIFLFPFTTSTRRIALNLFITRDPPLLHTGETFPLNYFIY
jgi:hypothetical protein